MLLGLSGRGAGEGTREMKQACLWHAWAAAQNVCLRLEKKYRAVIWLVPACSVLTLRQGWLYLKQFSFCRQHDKLEQAHGQRCDFGQVTLGLYFLILRRNGLNEIGGFQSQFLEVSQSHSGATEPTRAGMFILFYCGDIG